MKTKKLGEEIGVKEQSIRKRLCQTGSYFGLRPVKMPNRRLDWPDDSKEQLRRRGQK